MECVSERILKVSLYFLTKNMEMTKCDVFLEHSLYRQF